MQDLEALNDAVEANDDQLDTYQFVDLKTKLAIAERLDGILTEMKESRLQQQGARNEAPGHAQNLYGPA